MRETLLVFSLVALPMLLCTPEAASAKSPTVKISISGGGLTRVIEVTDPQILALSNIWSARFLALIQPLIARAEDQQNSGAEAKEFPNSPRIIVDGWTKPHSGWLYILDPRSESKRPGSRVWLFDPETQKVMGSVRAGYQPDFALSPDGRHLYVVSGERESGELAAIDTATGAIEHFPFPERILYKPW